MLRIAGYYYYYSIVCGNLWLLLYCARARHTLCFSGRGLYELSWFLVARTPQLSKGVVFAMQNGFCKGR